MKRFSLALAVLCAVPVLAQDTDWKWDPSKKHVPAVGEKFFQVDEELQEIKSKIVMGKEEPKNENQLSALKYRVVHEILAVEGNEVSKERIAIERWSVQREKDEPEDKSLTGKTVLVEGTGDKRKVTFEGSSEGVTDQGKKWVELTLARSDPMEQIEKLFPKAPVAADGEWTLDPTKLAEEIFQGTEIDKAQSTAKGTLKNVRVEDGVRMGDVQVDVKLQLKQVPNAPVAWKEGGLVDLVVTIQGSLEPEKSRKRAVKMDLKLKGRAEQESPEGAVSVKMDMRMTTSFTSGDMPKK